MAYFPAFLKFDNVKIVIIGGGKIANDKLNHLLDFTTNIKIIAPTINKDIMSLIDKYNLKYEQRIYYQNEIQDFSIVIVAVNDILLQEQIFNESKLLNNCLVNSVDSTKYCNFIFPSYIKKDDLTIAISTNGSSPAFSKYLRIFLQKLIPNSIGQFLKEMRNHRKTMPKGEQRMKFLDKKAQQYISTWKSD
jgi:precorrin-2 dehydrogenase/sirohydrochlorin ferrochelatase